MFGSTWRAAAGRGVPHPFAPTKIAASGAYQQRGCLALTMLAVVERVLLPLVTVAWMLPQAATYKVSSH